MKKKKARICPDCGSCETIKNGVARGVQTYLCHDCSYRFSGTRRKKKDLSKQLWKDYVFGKQTVSQLAETFDLDSREIRLSLNSYVPRLKQHKPRSIHLVIDGTYFGERREETNWCTVVARDPEKSEDLVWSFEETETTYAYVLIREELERLGYTILSVTGDGFPGIKTAFSGVPFQMCHVHMERLVIKGTTRKPQTEAGQVLLALVRTLHEYTDEETFERRLNRYLEKYRDFLNEKTIHPISGEQSWTHEDLRSASLSLCRFKRYLFTYQQNDKIPRTTNSLEGHFRHVKRLIGAHTGLSKKNKERILQTIFNTSTTSPNKKRLEEVL